MNYAEAKKQAAKLKPQENYAIVKLAYSQHVIVPLKDGIALLGTLANAQKWNSGYGTRNKISPLDLEDFSMEILSAKDYERHQIAVLLEVSYEDVLTAENTERYNNQNT